MSSASKRASGGVNGPVLYASISYHLKQLCAGFLHGKKAYNRGMIAFDNLLTVGTVIRSSLPTVRVETARNVRIYFKDENHFPMCSGVSEWCERSSERRSEWLSIVSGDFIVILPTVACVLDVNMAYSVMDQSHMVSKVLIPRHQKFYFLTGSDASERVSKAHSAV